MTYESLINTNHIRYFCHIIKKMTIERKVKILSIVCTTISNGRQQHTIIYQQ